MTTDIDIGNRALSAISARDSITVIDDSTKEGKELGLIFVPVRDQLLRAALWNFARRTINLNLIKASPGTPLSPVTNASQWTPSYPAPPWLYEYQYPTDCKFMRYVTSQAGIFNTGVPIFSTPQFTYTNVLGMPPQRFIIGSDAVGPIRAITNITQAAVAVVTSIAHGFANGNIVYITGVIGMTEVNGLFFTVANAAADTYELSGINSTSYGAYASEGVGVNQTQTAVRQNVVLTNALGAVGTYNMLITDYDLWDDLAQQALVSALAGFLAMPLTGDKDLATRQIAQANASILTARAVDGNEGLTFQDTTPDWIRIRSEFYQGPGGMGSNDYFAAPYGSLFALS